MIRWQGAMLPAEDGKKSYLSLASPLALFCRTRRMSASRVAFVRSWSLRSLLARSEARGASRPWWYAGFTTFWASGLLLVLQQVSFRLLAPLVGSSLETWSAIIAVFLLGIAAGNVLGGSLAERFKPLHVLRGSWLVSSVAVVLMPPLATWLAEYPGLATLPLGLQIGIAALVVCFPAAVALSVFTPPAVRALVQGDSDTGRVAGTIFALGTVGSLVGNYLTGFVLIPRFDIHVLVYAVAASCLPLCAPWGRRSPMFSRQPQPLPEAGTNGTDANGTDANGINTAGTNTEGRTRATAKGPLAEQDSLVLSWPAAVALVFLGSFVSGTLESAAFRMLAPLAGFSLFLSTGVVGVVLSGMSLGNYCGGRWAASAVPTARLRQALGGAALFTALIAPVLRNWAAHPWLDTLPAIPKILFWSFALFFVPSFLLGTLSPLVIRLAIRQVQGSGHRTGQLYAWSTLGCIVGILSTAWCFIELLGVYRLTALCAVLLAPLPWLVRNVSLREQWQQHRGAWLTVLGLALGYVALVGSPYDYETRYFSIKVLDGEREGRPIKRLVLDHLIHSDVDLTDPNWLGYKHEAIQGAFTRYVAERVADPQVLVIGGGGYTFPRWVEHQPELKNVQLQVVEIDPGVTAVAHEKLGLPRDLRMVSHHCDGRQFVRQAPAGTFHLVIQDAVNDYTVPWHLMTREYNQLIRHTLAADGVYLLTVIDSVTDGPFLRAAYRTLARDFAHVRLLAPTDHWHNSARSVYVLAGFTTSQRSEAILSQLDPTLVHAMPRDQAEQLLLRDGPHGVIFTDRHAPVDSLLSGLHWK
jgi:MFS family permease